MMSVEASSRTANPSSVGVDSLITSPVFAPIATVPGVTLPDGMATDAASTSWGKVTETVVAEETAGLVTVVSLSEAVPGTDGLGAGAALDVGAVGGA